MADFKRFYRQAAVYTVGNFVYRAAAFLLVPLYVRTLPTDAYGTLELITTTVLIIQSVLGSGIAHSALRFYFEYDDPEDRKAVISTALIASFILSAVGALASIFAAPALSTLVFHSTEYTLAFRIACLSMVLEISREINLAYVRARERAALFISMSLVQLCTQVAASLIAVVYLKLGVVGILAANVVATFCVWAVLTTFTMRECGWRFRTRLLMPVARYGQPLMFAMLAGSIFQSLDRYFLNGFVSLQALGLYALAMRIANVVPVLVVTPFTNTYGPYRLSIMSDPAAPDVYQRVAKYYLIIAGGIMIAVGGLSREVVRLLAAPEYWQAYTVVPLLLIPGTLGGLNYCFQTGIYVQKSTKHLLYISTIAGCVNAVGLVVLVPPFGTFGAAIAAVIAYAYTISHNYVIAQKLMPVPYRIGQLARIFAISCVLMGLACMIQIDSIWHAVAAKTLLVALYPACIVLARVLDSGEVQAMRAVGAMEPVKHQVKGAAS
jgi:O-antigen/teichoic acid export membrane protein